MLLASSLALIACFLLAVPGQPVYASGPSLSIGTIQVAPDPTACGSGWYYYGGSQGNVSMNCFGATVNCSNVASNISPLNLTFGYLSPQGVLPGALGLEAPLGVIVLHGGDGGTSPASFALTDYYFKAGFEVVQVAWSDDWEMISDPMTGTGNVQNTACRPATFFNYVYSNIFPTVYNAKTNPKAGMCGLGDSAGSAAITYSLAYYGAGAWFDQVELLSGPVLGDLKQGCEVPNNTSTTICSPNSSNGGWGCQLGGLGTWTLSAEYVGGAQTAVQKWTNESSSCAGQNNTSTGSNADWLAESVVDQSTGAAPTFSYPNTGMSAWLCRSVVNSSASDYNCAANHNANPYFCPNNSSSQGQIFYQNIANGTPNFNVYAVDNCVTAEGVGAGNVPGFQPSAFGGNVSGQSAISYDMAGVGSPYNIPAQCVYRHAAQ